MKKQKGFTIIELLIVILISGIMLAIAASVGKSWSRRADYDSAVKELRENIFDAKIRAASENRFIKFEFERTKPVGPSGIKYTAWIQSKFVNPWDEPNAWEKLPSMTDVLMSERDDMLTPSDNLPDDFAISPGGHVYKDPIGQTSAPVRIEFTLKMYEDVVANLSTFESLFTLHPWGGTKIERKKP